MLGCPPAQEQDYCDFSTDSFATGILGGVTTPGFFLVY